MGLLPSFRLRVRPLPVGTRAVEHHSAQPPLKAKACSDYQVYVYVYTSVHATYACIHAHAPVRKQSPPID